MYNNTLLQIEEFYNELTGDYPDDVKYQNALEIWVGESFKKRWREGPFFMHEKQTMFLKTILFQVEFECETMLDLVRIYQTVDVVLLADVFSGSVQ